MRVYVPPPPSFIEFDKADIATSIPARFERQVTNYPDRLAIKTKDQIVTYSQLNQIANRLTQAILAQRGTDEEPVALLLEPGPKIIEAILGVAKAGKFWTTLDPTLPRERIAYILKELEAKLIITDNRYRDFGRNLVSETQLLNLDELDPDLPAKNPDLPISPDRLAYVLYTSGSTGQPKGVIHSHRNVLHSIWWHTNSLRICATDRLSLLASFGHIAGITATFRALFNGGAVFPYNLKKEGLTHLAEWLMAEEISLYQSVPTLFRHFVDTLTGAEQFPKLRLIHLGGEPVSQRDVELYKKHFADDCILLNNLGSTEVSTFRQFFMDKTITLNGDLAPVGYEVPDKQLLLLDENGQEVGANEVGEIAIKSAYLSLGYWGRPDLTQAAFQPNPNGGNERLYHTGDLGRLLPDGRLVHVGRKDSQVKIRGQRVEIAEIEATLLGHGQLKEAAITLQEGAVGQRLAAYVVPFPRSSLTAEVLHHFLEQKLPAYMVPSDFVFLEALPLLPNGKLDRRALPKIDLDRIKNGRAFIAPRDALELQLAKIWEQVFEVRPIGVKDNFFELGGHSLLAATLLFQVNKVFEQDLPLASLFQAPNIEQMAHLLRQEGQSLSAASLVPLRTEGTKPPFFCLPGNLGNVFTDLSDLTRYLGADQPVYGLQDGPDHPSQIEALAKHYLDQIRAVQPAGPYFLGGMCAGGVIAFEMAQQLQAQGEQVGVLALIEPAPPHGPGLSAYLDFTALLVRRLIRRFKYHSNTLTKLDSNQQRTYARLKTKLMANSWALRRYTPKPYAGTVQLFLTEDSLKSIGNPQLKWQDLGTADVILHQIPGNHDAITGNNDTRIEAAYMQVLAEKLKLRIEWTLANRELKHDQRQDAHRFSQGSQTIDTLVNLT